MVESESRFLWRQLIFFLKLPVLLVQILMGKKRSSELYKPLKELREFLFEPKATVTLIAINLIVFIFQILTPLWQNLIFQPVDLFQFNIIPIVSSWFLHASLMHLLANMLFLYIFGRIIEMHFGMCRMLMIYFGSAIISIIIAGLAGQGGIGASGAIAGLIAAAILIDPFYLTYLLAGIPIPIIVIGWLAIISDITGILFPMATNIGHFAHLGGYLAITILVFLLEKKDRDQMKLGLLINVLFVILLLLLYSL